MEPSAPSANASGATAFSQRGNTIRGRGYGLRLKLFFVELLLRVVHGLDLALGPVAVATLMLPLAWADARRRRGDYAQFLRLRAVLPPEIWKGFDPARHQHDLIRRWHNSGTAVLCYHHLGSPAWQKRFHIEGTPPWELPGWKTRPVVVAFIHTGAFPVIPYWLRSRGIPTACTFGGVPLYLRNRVFDEVCRKADQRFGLQGVPLIFARKGPAIREAFRFLAPGKILAMPLDGGRISAEHDVYDAGGFPFHAKQGACRIAAHANAIVVPVAISCSDVLQFSVRFGRPLPDELLVAKNFQAATQFLVTELWTDLKQHPDEISWTVLEGVSPQMKSKRQAWL